MASENDPRLPFQEALNLVKLPSGTSTLGPTQRYMSTRAAYIPGVEFPPNLPRLHKAAYGGVVYGQAAFAACKAYRELEDHKGTKPEDRLGLHTVHGYFTAIGRDDRPYIYEVAPATTSRTFSTVSVMAYQASVPSTNSQLDNFPLKDASLPVGTTAFSGMCSFKAAEPHSNDISKQEDSAQKRYASILGTRRPEEWPPAPPVDIDALKELDLEEMKGVGTFPVVDMKKVDMTAYNEGKPYHERIELVLYRLLKPLPSDGTDGYDANAHIVAHAFTIDRNGLLMAGNHLGFGYSFGRVASLSYTFTVHVNADEAVMREGEDEWWIQELSFPRAGAGRGIVMSKVWSPQGLHVATEYQDGLIRVFEDRSGKQQGKL